MPFFAHTTISIRAFSNIMMDEAKYIIYIIYSFICALTFSTFRRGILNSIYIIFIIVYILRKKNKKKNLNPFFSCILLRTRDLKRNIEIREEESFRLES